MAIQGLQAQQVPVDCPAVSVRVLEPKVLRARQLPAEMAAMVVMASTPLPQGRRVAAGVTAEMAATSAMAAMAA